MSFLFIPVDLPESLLLWHNKQLKAKWQNESLKKKTVQSNGCGINTCKKINIKFK